MGCWGPVVWVETSPNEELMSYPKDHLTLQWKGVCEPVLSRGV